MNTTKALNGSFSVIKLGLYLFTIKLARKMNLGKVHLRYIIGIQSSAEEEIEEFLFVQFMELAGTLDKLLKRMQHAWL